MFKKLWNNFSKDKKIESEQVSIQSVRTFTDDELSKIEKAKEYIRSIVTYPQNLNFDESYIRISDDIVSLRFTEENGKITEQRIKVQ